MAKEADGFERGILEMVLGKRAMLLIGSPMCTAFSQLQKYNFGKMPEEKKQDIIKMGRTHLKFCMLLIGFM